MRTSGTESDLGILLVPLTVLIVVGIGFYTGGARLFPKLERELWGVVSAVGHWVSSLFS